MFFPKPNGTHLPSRKPINWPFHGVPTLPDRLETAAAALVLAVHSWGKSLPARETLTSHLIHDEAFRHVPCWLNSQVSSAKAIVPWFPWSFAPSHDFYAVLANIGASQEKPVVFGS